jgi:hypothetical protein
LFAVPDLLAFLLPTLEEQLVASHHETKEARLWEVLLMEDHEHVVVLEIRQGAGIAPAALQLHTDRDFHQVAPRFLDHVS